MQKTVVIVVQAPEADLPRGQPLVITTNGRVQEVAIARGDKANDVRKSTIHPNAVPPFWTWFVENPRPGRRAQLSQL